MKFILLTLLMLACTVGSAALLATQPKVIYGGNTAQAMCMPGDTARGCWHSLEHRLN